MYVLDIYKDKNTFVCISGDDPQINLFLAIFILI